MNIQLKHWTPGGRVTAAELNRMVEAIRRATPVAGKGISISQGLGGSVIAVSGDAGGGGAGGEYAPFTMRVVDEALMVYLPKGCLQVTAGAVAADLMVVDTSKNAVTAHEDWYVAAEGYNADSYANREVYACVDIANSRFFIAGTSFFPADSYRFCIGKVLQDGDGTISPQQYVAGSVVIADRRGGGGGSLVEVTDRRTNTTSPGVVGYTGSSDGVVGFVAKDGIGPDLVIFALNGASIGTLADYLAGRLDFSEEGAGSPYIGMGVNVTTDNFEDECLGSSITPDETPDPNVAAPSAHTHTLNQFTGSGEDGELTADDVIDFFSNAGMWDALGESGPSGEGPSEDSLLTVGDIEDDPSFLKHDSATPSAGDPSTDLLVLSGHQHPLNVADEVMATGPTGEEVAPPAGDYVKAVGIGVTGPSGEASPTTAMFGTDPHYARTDHIHPICAEMGPTGTGATGEVGPTGGMELTEADVGDFGPTDAPTGITLDQHTWTPGAQGYEESYCTRIVKVVGAATTTRYAIFRRRKVSRTGVVVWVGPEYVGYRVLTTSN